MSEAHHNSQAAFLLPARLDTNAASKLRERLLELSADKHANVSLDASRVEYIGGLCLQLIVASHARIVACSEKASEALELFGVRAQLVEECASTEVSV